MDLPHHISRIEALLARVLFARCRDDSESVFVMDAREVSCYCSDLYRAAGLVLANKPTRSRPTSALVARLPSI